MAPLPDRRRRAYLAPGPQACASSAATVCVSAPDSTVRVTLEFCLDSAREDLAAVVQKALEPAHVSVWMNERGETG